MSKIFVSIASYCDPLLPKTIQNALENARYPERLSFGVVEQSDVRYIEQLSEQEKKQVRLISIDKQQSNGACWARSLVTSLQNEEDWFFQIDSHTVFDEYWDVCLLSSWLDCVQKSKRPYISGYPHPYEIKNGEVVKIKATKNIIGNVVVKDKTFTEKVIDLSFHSVLVDKQEPIMDFHVAAGCVFAPIRLINQVPYDPNMYFHGEESSFALRTYTHGWDVFHVPQLPVYHYYDTGPELEVKRVKHWSEEENTQRQIKWTEMNTKANLRMESLIKGKDMGIYSLGNQRSLQEYADYCGIDYQKREIHSKAYSGTW